MKNECPESISVGDTKYIREDLIQQQIVPKGDRAVVVVDRGWIWAGDVEDIGDAIRLTRALWVFRWESIGFDGVIKDPKHKSVQIKPMPQPVEIPKGSVIFRIAVPQHWGL